jgi:hypothetical protein
MKKKTDFAKQAWAYRELFLYDMRLMQQDTESERERAMFIECDVRDIQTFSRETRAKFLIQSEDFLQCPSSRRVVTKGRVQRLWFTKNTPNNEAEANIWF